MIFHLKLHSVVPDESLRNFDKYQITGTFNHYTDLEYNHQGNFVGLLQLQFDVVYFVFFVCFFPFENSHASTRKDMNIPAQFYSVTFSSSDDSLTVPRIIFTLKFYIQEIL